VTTGAFPTPSPVGAARARVREDYLKAVLDDLNSIVRVTQIKPKRVVVHVTPDWKVHVLAAVKEAAAKGERNPGELIKRFMADPQTKPFAKDIPAFVQKSLKEAVGGGADGIGADEYDTLASARQFLSQELGAAVEVYRADDQAAPDPGKKRHVASPRKPAIYVE